ncbi:hypothetical protein [Mucilaginibacter sp.]
MIPDLAYKKLDTVLDLLRDKEEQDKDVEEVDYDATNRAFVSNYLLEKFNYEMTAKELGRIFSKLFEDGYINDITGNLYLTHEGYWFHGYVEQNRIDEINRSISETNEMVAIRNDSLLVFWTRFAGIAAVALLAWQIFLYFYPIHANFRYFFWQ